MWTYLVLYVWCSIQMYAYPVIFLKVDQSSCRTDNPSIARTYYIVPLFINSVIMANSFSCNV